MLSCMLIDDDQDEIDIFTMALHELEVEAKCIGYTDCSKALSDLSNGLIVPDCIFLDVNLSGINGKDCLKKILEIRSLPNVSVVMFSGCLSEEEVSLYRQLGVRDCILKGNSLGDLTAKLNRFFAENFKMQS